NLLKLYTDDRFKSFITEKNKIRTEKFVLSFNEKSSLFEFVDDSQSSFSGRGEDFLSRMTVKNNVYRESLDTNRFYSKMNLAGENLNISDTIVKREWKVTENTR